MHGNNGAERKLRATIARAGGVDEAVGAIDSVMKPVMNLGSARLRHCVSADGGPVTSIRRAREPWK